MSNLWRGSWATRIRIATGLILFVYALTHFLNIGLGLISPDLMDRAQIWRQVVTRSLPGEILLYGALLGHAGLALWRVAGRRTLRLPFWEAVQTLFGLLIPLILIAHVMHTRVAHALYDVNDQMGFIMVLLWGSLDGWKQSLLMLLVWTHGCIGLHFWLRMKPWWRRSLPALVGAAVLVPGFALAGFLAEGRRMRTLFGDDDSRAALFQLYNWPDQNAFAALATMTDRGVFIFWAILALAALVYLARRFSRSRRAVRIRYIDGPEVTSPKGPTLLEMSRANGVPHTSLCGGRGRCTTCRVVIEEGGELLHPPSEAELNSLKAVNAPPNTRLACQIRPTGSATVFRVFQPDGRRRRAHASQGQERRLAILFLDMRGFTARTTGQLPYDVVFLLNRFFDAVVPAITSAGGTIDKYLGDGLLAVFDAADASRSAQAGLRAAAGIGVALAAFNETLDREGLPPVRIGIGLHLGELVLGEIGAAGNAPRTIIGDTVNAASRLEGQTKDLAVELLVSSAILESAGYTPSRFELITLDLRGVAEPLPALALAQASDLPGLLEAVADDPTSAETV